LISLIHATKVAITKIVGGLSAYTNKIIPDNEYLSIVIFAVDMRTKLRRNKMTVMKMHIKYLIYTTFIHYI